MEADRLDGAKGTCRLKGFKALLLTQFLGALNDNLYKLAVSILAVRAVSDEALATRYVSLAGALFVLPFLLFAPAAGYFADRLSKTSVIRATKLLEIAVMACAAYFFYAGSVPGLLAVLFFMGAQSALFSPAKYGILPEMLNEDELSRANGYLQFWTFAAILAGTALGGPVMAAADERHLLTGAVLLAVAAAGFAASYGVARVPAAQPQRRFDLNGLRAVAGTLGAVKRDQPLWLAFQAAAFFWFAGAFVQLNTLLYAAQILKVGDVGLSALLTLLALGIGVGSLCAGRVSEHKVELGLVPLGSLGLALFSAAIGATHHSVVWASAWMFGLGFSGGIFIVPLNAFIQKESPAEARGSYLAALACLTSAAMLIASGALWLFKGPLGLSGAQLYGIIAVLALVATARIVWVMPALLVRCINFLLTHSLYRLTVVGKENLPDKTGALLVCNHVSYADPALLLAAVERPIRFLMARSIYEMPLVKPVAKIMGAIPISGNDKINSGKALEIAKAAVQNGELVCIFAEGAHTRTGNLLPFRNGLKLLMRDLNAPVIPVCLDQVWGSIFSHRDGKVFAKLPEEVPYPVTVAIGRPMPEQASVGDARRAVQELWADAFKYRGKVYKLLHVGFMRQAKRNYWRGCMSDSTGVELTYGKALTGALALSERFKKLKAPTRLIGVLLPSSVAAALTNIGLLMAGKVPVNLNFTASREALDGLRAHCNLETVITSKRFLEKLGMAADPTMVMLEDVKASIGRGKQLSCLLATLLLPGWWLRHLVFREKAIPEDLATVLFSSGSTGAPKGAMLTHANIASNIEAVYDVYRISKNDRVLGVLPFFHSFGFTGTLWLPLLAGASVAYHPNPLDAGTIGKLCEKNRSTVLLSTPTFLGAYMRKCAAEQLQSLRHVIVGAEQLREPLALAFKEKFGILPMEGYGATELSPFAAVNVADYAEGARRQTGNRMGTIGHPLPGTAVKIIDPESGRELQDGEPGLLWVKGPNVMRGYLNSPEKTAEVIKDGWYNTGDMALIDEYGFIRITGRFSRFSKIGGEMVPHVRIEDAINALGGGEDRLCAVTSVPDEKKGERLIVLYSSDLDIEGARAALAQQGLPGLWIPKGEDFIRVDSIPILGTGKLDLKKTRELALEKVRAA